ncbi:MAG: phosphate/phosphite/phosphonate ABC transporter substrate-binding protein [Magnetococcus sp. YQC-5]
MQTLAAHHKQDKYLHQWIGMILAAVVFWSVESLAEPVQATRILYYNPEISIDNFLALEEKFNQFLADKGTIRFIPNNSVDAFEKTMGSKTPEETSFLISSWYYKTLRNSTPLRPLLIGARKERSSQKKLLVSRKGENERSDNINIASATSQDFATQLLAEMSVQTGKWKPKKFSILRVPKDLDALMSVAFKMSDAALASEHGWNHLRQINPTQFEQLQVLAESKEIPLPVLAVKASKTDRSVELMNLFLTMNQSEKGETALRLIGLDQFRPPSPAEEQFLNQ